MARMTKAAKAIETAVEAAYSKHFNQVPVNMMDLGKIMNVGRDALKAGQDLDAAMIGAVAKFRQDEPVTIPDDGYADGGEPYTDEEMEIIDPTDDGKGGWRPDPEYKAGYAGASGNPD